MSDFDPIMIKDSGERRFFGTGSVRDVDTGKGSPSLLSVFALRRYARHMQNGAKKYAARNWEKGQPDSSYFDSAFRHLLDFAEGKKDEDHLGAALWNVACLIHNDELVSRGLYPEHFHDMADYSSKESFEKTVTSKVTGKINA